MLQATIHHDLTQYKAKAAFGMSFRSVLLIGSGAAVAVAMGLYVALVLGLDIGDCFPLIAIPCSPFFACLVARPGGLPMERWFPLWVRHKLTRRRVLYKTNARDREAERTARAGREAKRQQKFRTMNGIERAATQFPDEDR